MKARNAHQSLFPVVRSITKFALATVLLLAFSIAANAYTLVFRDGRRIEVPGDFTVTQTTLTYEVAPGFSRTVQLILLDVAATERANKELPGGFFKHGKQNLPAPLSLSSPRAPATVTNRELAPVKKRRLESERAYEKRRLQLGLPSLEETRRRQAQEDAETREWLRQRALAEARSETYWRQRAAALRGEIASLDAGIGYLQARLGQVPRAPLIMNPVVTGVFGWPGTVFGYPYGYPVWPGVGLPTRSFDFDEDSYQRAKLTERLDSLLVARAGLEAKWRQLEDEARDARVPQIWLEP
jgi:hypothetical protein